MSQLVQDGSGWFDITLCVRRETRRHHLRALLARPFRALSIRVSRVLLALVLLTGVLKASLVEAFFVPSSSMTPTLREKDYILVPKFLYGLRLPLLEEAAVKWAAPKRGDVIVFKHKSTDRDSEANEALVKRVIAVEGDLVEIVGRTIVLNGTHLVEPYAEWGSNQDGSYHFGPSRVPSGSLFVLGDNRGNSEDSRFWSDPFVSLSQVVGKAVMVYWSGGQNNRAGIVL